MPTGSREMTMVAAVLFFLIAAGAALPWPPEVSDGHFFVGNHPSASPSHGRQPGDFFGYSLSGDSPPVGNDVGWDDGDDTWDDLLPSRDSPSTRRPNSASRTTSDTASIFFPGSTAGPSRFSTTKSPATSRPSWFSTTRSPATSRPSTVARRNSPTPATARPWSSSSPPGTRRPAANTNATPSQRPGNTRTPGSTHTPTTTNSRRRQDCQRYRQLARAFKENSTIAFKIVGGNQAREGEFPYMAALGFTGGNGVQFSCGGSLISERYILTAAHCISDAARQNLRLSVARLGQTQLTQGGSGAGDYAVEEVTLHPDYDGRLRYNDVALLRLDRAVRFSASASPICLPDADAAPPPGGTTVLVAGWGATDTSGIILSTTLLKAALQVVERGECAGSVNNVSGLPRGLSDSMLCARDPAGRSDTCSGDSGGPLVLRSLNGEDTLLGVTSFGDWPCRGRLPGVYSMTSAVISWIEGIVWP